MKESTTESLNELSYQQQINVWVASLITETGDAEKLSVFAMYCIEREREIFSSFSGIELNIKKLNLCDDLLYVSNRLNMMLKVMGDKEYETLPVLDKSILLVSANVIAKKYLSLYLEAKALIPAYKGELFCQ